LGRWKRAYPIAAHDIIDVIAKLSGTGAYTSADAEFGIGEEARPFVVLNTGAKGVSVKKATN
jgi:hypothetical protein